MGIWYASREEVQESLQFNATTVLERSVDSALEFASRKAERDLNRIFYPTLATRTFDWPTPASPYSWRLWLDAEDEIISASEIVSGGVLLDPSAYLLGPANTIPSDRIEINLGGPGSFDAGDTFQRSLSVFGLFGYADDSEPAGELADDVSDATTTTVTVSDSYAVGVGTVIRARTERMLVTAKSWIATINNTGTTLTDSLTDQSTSVTQGSSFTEGEVILVDAERMRITAIVGNTLYFDRAVDGSTLAEHTIGTAVAVRRLCTVVRGVLGTTAAEHLMGDPLTRYVAPGLVHELTIAEAVNTVLQKASGYARMVGTGEGARPAAGAALEDIRAAAQNAYGRRYRVGAV